MISADRFLVRSTNRGAWNLARSGGVTATMAASAGTPSGFREVVATMGIPDVHVEGNPYFDFGNEQEPMMMRFAHDRYGILDNDWLIAAEHDRRIMATPDGLNLDHTLIAECKTTGDPWEGAEGNLRKIPIKYRRQVQFQLMVTGAERCLFLWLLREEGPNGFYTPWLEPRFVWIERDETMISELVAIADRLLSLEDANGF